MNDMNVGVDFNHGRMLEIIETKKYCFVDIPLLVSCNSSELIEYFLEQVPNTKLE
ncbi:hypothetical protein [Sporosarcina sp. 6E9]|uniref:hypothetical protein n=1 Tax=Sporosarcina sp. 6E9 TaxID=2819235 RepID=UPI001B30364F|nr:hypothetical protein [Sporosarcina sp. 6E9]